MSTFDESHHEHDDERDDLTPRVRLSAAAADRALFGGSASVEELELANELDLDLDAEDRAFEQCVALLAEARVNIDRERAPKALEARLHALCSAIHQVPPRETTSPRDVALPRTLRPRFDWREAYFDPTTNEGLLVIEGLAPNDPTVEQYQLWIFDAARDERYPVDGGVFDVQPNEPTRVPVVAKLPVSSPKLFAVTIEKPGGAVVSERRIALLAKP